MTRRLFRNKIVYRSLTLAFLFLVTLTMSAQWASPQEEGGVPAYNAGPPPKGTKLPALLTKADLWGADAQNAYQTHAYELAAKIPNVIVTSFNRNFRGRNDSNAATLAFIGSPELVVAKVLAGSLSFNPITDTIPGPTGPVKLNAPSAPIERDVTPVFPKPSTCRRCCSRKLCGMNRSRGCPIASAAVQRNIFSAAALNSTMRCVLSTLMIASIAEPTMLAMRASLS